MFAIADQPLCAYIPVSVRTVVRKSAGEFFDELLALTLLLLVSLLLVVLAVRSSRDHSRISTCSSLTQQLSPLRNVVTH
jgi:hypothetical protein